MVNTKRADTINRLRMEYSSLRASFITQGCPAAYTTRMAAIAIQLHKLSKTAR